MTIEPKEKYFRIKDSCRKNLIRYLEEAFCKIPPVENPHILDIGCGTGLLRKGGFFVIHDEVRDLFKSDLDEIAYYRVNPAAFRSVYYIVQKL